MTPQIALSEGRLNDALDLQFGIVRDSPDDSAARLFLFELLLIANRWSDSRATLRAIRSADPEWPESRRWHGQLIRAARQRSRGRRPSLIGTIPLHARELRKANRYLALGSPDGAIRKIDSASHSAPHLTGHVDGREFDGLRDLDDRTATVLEVFLNGKYFWLPFEQIRRLTLAPAERVLHSAYRPARILMRDSREFDCVLPLIYTSSSAAEEFLLGLQTDCVPTDGGPMICMGARTLMLGEEELPLGDIQQLELRIAT